MLTEIEIQHIAKKRCLILKYVRDTRYDSMSKFPDKETIITHNGTEFSNINIIAVGDLADADTLIRKEGIQCLGIDEIQFMEHCEYIIDWARCGIDIIIAGLDGDFKADPFQNISYLVPHCDKIKKLSAVCMQCYGVAPFTVRINTQDSEIEKIGGSEIYSPMCRKCKNFQKK
jgi:thymidine kinase